MFDPYKTAGRNILEIFVVVGVTIGGVALWDSKEDDRARFTLEKDSKTYAHNPQIANENFKLTGTGLVIATINGRSYLVNAGDGLSGTQKVYMTPMPKP